MARAAWAGSGCVAWAGSVKAAGALSARVAAWTPADAWRESGSPCAEMSDGPGAGASQWADGSGCGVCCRGAASGGRPSGHMLGLAMSGRSAGREAAVVVVVVVATVAMAAATARTRADAGAAHEHDRPRTHPSELRRRCGACGP